MTPSKKAKKGAKSGPDFSRNNYLILGLGLVFLIVGFIFLMVGDITISPILLVLGYCVIIPVGILYPKKKIETEGLAAGKESSTG